MEHAIWLGKSLHADEISADYGFEKEVRKASGKKELLCPDPECTNRIVRYCHGDQKEAYFAHLDNCSCDYSMFDRNSTQGVRSVRRTIYEHFKENGYNVQIEVKILKHHYTHLLFTAEDGRLTAVEIGTQRLSANKVDTLTEEYHKNNIDIKWIVVGDTKFNVRENEVFFLKRYLLNESKNKDLIVINSDCSEVGQYKFDPNTYIYDGVSIHSENYPDAYIKYGTLDSLIFEDGELCLSNFYKDFDRWIDKKSSAFHKKIASFKEKAKQLEKKQLENMHRLPQNEGSSNPKKQQPIMIDNVKVRSVTRQSSLAVQQKTYEERKQEIILTIDQQTIQARDSNNVRWVRCTECNKIDIADCFSSYGGQNRVNLGICTACDLLKRK